MLTGRRVLTAVALVGTLATGGCVGYGGYYDDGYGYYNDGYYDDGWGYSYNDGYYRRGNYYYNDAYPGYTFGNGGYWYNRVWYARPVVVHRYDGYDRGRGRRDGCRWIQGWLHRGSRTARFHQRGWPRRRWPPERRIHRPTGAPGWRVAAIRARPETSLKSRPGRGRGTRDRRQANR